MYYIILFSDGSMCISKLKPEKDQYQEGAKFFEVDKNLTVADISEVWSGNGWFRKVFPERLQEKITVI